MRVFFWCPTAPSPLAMIVPWKGFESSAKGLRLETIAANVKTSDDYHYLWNSDIPCRKEGTPFEYIHQVRPRRPRRSR